MNETLEVEKHQKIDTEPCSLVSKARMFSDLSVGLLALAAIGVWIPAGSEPTKLYWSLFCCWVLFGFQCINLVVQANSAKVALSLHLAKYQVLGACATRGLGPKRAMPGKAYLLILMLPMAAACTEPEDSHMFTLYSNHFTNTMFRGHVATFDATPKEGARKDEAWTKSFAEDNWHNCEKVAKLLKEEWDLSTKGMSGYDQQKFWCEKGRYRR